MDAEDGWFVRCNHHRAVRHRPAPRGADGAAAEPLLFLNIEGKPGAPPALGAHRGCPRRALPEPARGHPAPGIPDVIRGGGCGRAQHGVRTPPVHRVSAPATASSASSTCCRRRWPGSGGWWHRAATPTRASSRRRHERRGRRLLLALRHRAHGRPREPAAEPDHRDPRGPLCADPEPEHRRLGGRLHAAVDHPRVPREARRGPGAGSQCAINEPICA
jgi:hypothetical protein